MTLFLGGLFLTLRGLFAIVEEAYEFPIVTSTQLTTKTSVPFPAITVCNINRINCLNIMGQVEEMRLAGEEAAAVELRLLSDNIGCTSQVRQQ